MNTLKINQTVKKEETTEREITLPFFYIHHGSLGPLYVKVVDAERAVNCRTPEHCDGKLTAIDCTSTNVALAHWPICEEITREQFEDAYWLAHQYLKNLAVPEFVLKVNEGGELTDEERNEFPYSY